VVGCVLVLVTLLVFIAGASMVPAVVCAQSVASEPDTAAVDTDFDWSFSAPDVARWNVAVTTGFDAFVHAYPLATSDTTETIAEYVAQLGLEGHSSRQGRHRWNLRAETSMGTQLYRERIEAAYRLMDKERATRLRLNGSLRGRQYRRETEYILSSDNLEGRLDVRTYPLVRSGFGLEARGWSLFQKYTTPSALEVDHREQGIGTMARSRGLGRHLWSVRTLWSARSYPDSTRINRTTASLEADYELMSWADAAFSLHHRSDRRLIEDESVRPSAWIHWTDLDSAVPAGPGRVFCDLRSEIWSYDQEMSAYFDSWRIEGHSGFGWGEILGTRWRLGLTGERLEAGDSPETYSQFGLRGGVEAFDRDISGSLSVELGQRLYDEVADASSVTQSITDSLGPSLAAADDEFLFNYSDFSYWEIWLMAAWQINDHFSLDLLANYEPERHTKSIDDSALGFGSLRVTWRP
jgi:hypothetical protein